MADIVYNYKTLNALFTGIADAIRTKTGSTEAIIAEKFPTEIKNLVVDFDYINQEITFIQDYAFYGCDILKNVNCYNITSVGISAFENCSNLKTVVLYDGVTSVGENAFKGCGGLTIYCETSEKPEGWNDNWNPDDCEVIWGFTPVETWDISATEEDCVNAKLYNVNEHYSLIISGNGNMMDFKIDSVGSDAPWYTLLETKEKLSYYVVINNGVTNIGNRAFADCHIDSVTIPNSVTSIGSYAFYFNYFLTSVIIPNSVTSIKEAAFSTCSLTSVIIPDGVTSIEERAFVDCNLTSVTIPNSVTSIKKHAFASCTELISITYTGTISQWSSITFNNYWNNSTGNYTIHCTDGDIAKDGTITYR